MSHESPESLSAQESASGFPYPESSPAHEPASESTPAPELSPKPSPVPELNTLILHFLQFGHYIDPRIKKETKEEEGVLSYIP
ncbi:unnamed protein product [Leuciscus chuanchicus]